MRKKPGPKSLLTDSVILQMRNLVLDGKSTREVASTLGINEITLYDWKSNDYMQLATKWSTWQRERLLKIAEKNWNELANSEDERIKLEATRFISETLGKKWYSKAPDNVTVVNLPQPILDLGKVIEQKSIENKE